MSIEEGRLGKEAKDKLARFCVGGYGAVYDKALSDPKYWTGLGDQETGTGLRVRPVVEVLGLHEEEDCLC